MEKVPAGHRLHAEAAEVFENAPMPHAVQAVAAGIVEYVPARHGRHALELDWLVSELKVPMGHGVLS